MKTRFSMDYFIIAYVVLFFKDFSSNKKKVLQDIIIFPNIEFNGQCV